MREILHTYLESGIDFTMDEFEAQNKKKLLGVDDCQNLIELRKLVNDFNGCELKQYATNTVFSDGNPDSSIMLIGEAPGANEDAQGIPFCGASGKLLDKMLAAINLDRQSVYITNTVFWRPPGNRQPTYHETEICRPFVEKHIALIDPKIIVLVGGVAASSLLGGNVGISKIRGQFCQYRNKYIQKPITAMAIFHPAYLMRQPKQKRLAWEDLKKIRSYLDS